MGEITIREVNSKSDFNLFLKLPYQIFKNDKNWVPPLLFDEKCTFNKKKNPAFEFCSSRLFLAYKNGECVGRIAGILNNRANEIWSQKRIRFGWLDFIEDIEVLRALINSVEVWAKEENLCEILGPMGFTDMDKEGMMIEGFDTLCPMACYYNPSYYPRLLEELGFEKEVDWVQYIIKANQPIPDKISKISQVIKEKYNLKIITGISKKEIIKNYGHKTFRLVNESFSNLFGYVPLTEKQIDFYIKQYFTFIDPKLVCFIVDSNDDVIGFGVSMPSFSNALKKAKGRLFPFGWYYMLRAMKNYSHIDLYLNGVHPQWQNKGIHALYFSQMNKTYIELGSMTAIANPQLETNQAALIWQKYNSELGIRRRAYIKKIE